MAGDTVEIGKYEVKLQDGVLHIGLTVDLVEISGASLTVSGPPLKVEAQDHADITIAISEGAVAAFLEKKAPVGMRDFSVKIADGRLQIEAIKTVLVDLKMKAICSLRIDKGARVFIDLVSVDVMGAGIKQFVQNQLDKVNPVIDIETFPIRATLTDIVAESGMLKVNGTASPEFA